MLFFYFLLKGTKKRKRSAPKMHLRIRGVELTVIIPHGSTRIFHSDIMFVSVSHRVHRWYPSVSCKGARTYPLSLYALPRQTYPLLVTFVYYFLALGFTIFLQSRSPRSIAIMSISAIAILVATGTLLMSHRRRRLYSASSKFSFGSVLLK